MRLTNRDFEDLSGLGTKNPDNTYFIETANTNQVGVEISQSGAKKATTVEIVVPTRRTDAGSRTTEHVVLNGFQARKLYETLRSAYENGLINNT